MLLSILFPIADSRRFLQNSEKLRVPNWHSPVPDHDFIHFMGKIRHRIHGGGLGWAGEDKICYANRALRFCENLDLPSYKIGVPIALKCAFRQFFFDGRIVGKFEIGVQAKKQNLQLSRAQTKSLLLHYLNLTVKIPDPLGTSIMCRLIQAGKPLANLYLHASTSTINREKIENWQVMAGSPLIFVVCGKDDRIGIPRNAKYISIPKTYNFQLHYSRIIAGDRIIPMWTISMKSPREDYMARTLRLYLMRLHAEYSCLSLVLRNICANKFEESSGDHTLRELQEYFNITVKKITS